MFKKITIILLLCSFVFSQESRKKIVILDTGISLYFPKKYLCSEGHKDFSTLGLEDTIHHGTHLAFIISKYMNVKKECIIVVKWYNEFETLHSRGLHPALKYITEMHPDYVNMSFGGDKIDTIEEYFIQQMLNQGTIITVAAGNSSHNLNDFCNYYPACYAFNYNNKNFHVVGSCKNGIFEVYSNYGKVLTDCENGTDIKAGFYIMSGTSQSSAIKLGKLIKGIK